MIFKHTSIEMFFHLAFQFLNYNWVIKLIQSKKTLYWTLCIVIVSAIWLLTIFCIISQKAHSLLVFYLSKSKILIYGPSSFLLEIIIIFFFHFLFLFFLLRLPKFFLCLHSLKWKEEFWRALDLNCNSKFEKKPIHCKERKRGGRAEGRFHKKRQKSSQNTASFERSSSRSSTRQ